MGSGDYSTQEIQHKKMIYFTWTTLCIDKLPFKIYDKCMQGCFGWFHEFAFPLSNSTCDLLDVNTSESWILELHAWHVVYCMQKLVFMEVFILHWQPKFPLVHDVCFMAGAKYFLPLFRYATPGKCVFSASCTLIDLHGFNNSLTRFHPVLRGFGVSLCSVLQ